MEVQKEKTSTDIEEYPYPPPTTLEGLEIKKTGWSVQLVRQDEKYAYVKISCSSRARDWYTLKMKIPKNKLKITGG